MKTQNLIFITAGLALSALSFSASAESIGGKIVGHHCAHEGTTCPVSKLDPHITLEREFVLTTANGYYFMPNLPRDVKVRHVLDDVTISGNVDKRYNSIDVSSLTVKGQGKSAWSAAAQAMAQQEFSYFDTDMREN